MFDMHLHHYLPAVLIVILLFVADGRIYHVSPVDSHSCLANYSCMMLSDASFEISSNLDDNVVLIMLPGDHTLDTQLSLSNINEFSINSSDEASSTRIICHELSSIKIYNVTTVEINGLHFIGCGNSSITGVQNFTLRTSIFEDSLYGGVVLNETTSARISDCSFLFNIYGTQQPITDFTHQSIRAGGAMRILRSCQIQIENSLFSGNEAQHGGVIYTEFNNSIAIVNCTFSQNRAGFVRGAEGGSASGGGALFVKDSQLRIYNSQFTNNSVIVHSEYSSKGGAIVALNSEVSIFSSRFVNSAAANGTGGVIYVLHSTLQPVDHCYFGQNQAHRAAVMHIQYSNATISQSNFSQNSIASSSGEAGVAVVALYNSVANFTHHNTFANNIGSLFAYTSTIQFNGKSDFYNCTSTKMDHSVMLQEGGSVTSYSSKIIFQGMTTFSLNSAKYGGALFCVESTILITSTKEYQMNSTFSQYSISVFNNNATSSGGGMYLYHSTLIIKDGTVHLKGNCAFDNGGGIYALNSNVRLESSNSLMLLFTENHARLGGGVYLEGTSKLSILESNSTSVFMRNNAENGAAIYVNDYSRIDTCYGTPASLTPASECFFHIPDTFTLMPEANGTVLFYDNVAQLKGSNLFGGLLDRCISHSLTEPSETVSEKQTRTGLSYFQNASNINSLVTISSEPIQVCFCDHGLPKCTYHFISISPVRKGESFRIQVAAVDQVKSTCWVGKNIQLTVVIKKSA